MPARVSEAIREALLARAATAEAIAWASWWRAELRRQERPLEGGWPGTLSEARARIVRRVAAELGPDFALTPQELDRTARTTYGAARRDWNDAVVPETFD